MKKKQKGEKKLNEKTPKKVLVGIEVGKQIQILTQMQTFYDLYFSLFLINY